MELGRSRRGKNVEFVNIAAVDNHGLSVCVKLLLLSLHSVCLYCFTKGISLSSKIKKYEKSVYRLLYYSIAKKSISLFTSVSTYYHFHGC